jgi:hypothetical protein
MRSPGAVGAAAAVAVVLAFSSAAPAGAAFQGDVSERLSAGLGERLQDFSERVQQWRDKKPEKPERPGKPPVAETPELGSLLLFGSGAAGMAGYAVTRLRQRRPSGQ